MKLRKGEMSPVPKLVYNPPDFVVVAIRVSPYLKVFVALGV